ncbi:hypothetical protein BG015_006663 [Linnemannia schmuckeri]|uniref:Uncharacterized protein n=1 Tax=Linnemannia schmuckeri TaxID=64567 RepID=A0A9P5RZI1_9FUNG|nr:hypothetical protein BG015_006663 [Linnemannia schmuckeri]
MGRRNQNEDEIAPLLGNGCFNSSDTATTTPAAPEDLLLKQFARGSPTKSRMETLYLVSDNSDDLSRNFYHQTALQPCTPTSSVIHLNQIEEVEDLPDDRSPGWRYRLIKRTPRTHIADSIWRKYPSLFLRQHQQQQQQQQQNRLFPPTMTWNSIWTPWWVPAPITDTVATPVSFSPTISVPCDSVSLSSSSLIDEFFKTAVKYEDSFTSDNNLSLFSTNNKYNNKGQEELLITNGSSTGSTGASAAALAAITVRSDLLYKDTVFHHTTFASANSSTSSSRGRSCIPTHPDDQQDESRDVQQYQSQGQGQDQHLFDSEMLTAVPPLSTTAATTTTSMEFTDPLGASSPTLPDLPPTTESNGSIPAIHPGVNNTSSESRTTKNTQESPGPNVADAAREPVPIPSSFAFPFTPIVGLGIGLFCLTPYTSTNSTLSSLQMAAEAMDRIHHRVILASAELDVQSVYMTRSNRLVQLLRHDEEKEEKNDGGGEGKYVVDLDADSDLSAEAEIQEIDDPSSRVSSSGYSTTCLL